MMGTRDHRRQKTGLLAKVGKNPDGIVTVPRSNQGIGGT
jgi:hypothetical protein